MSLSCSWRAGQSTALAAGVVLAVGFLQVLLTRLDSFSSQFAGNRTIRNGRWILSEASALW